LDQDTARSLRASVGDSIVVYPPAAGKLRVPGGEGRTLTVVGVAGSVTTPDVTLWMSPDDVVARDPVRRPKQQMLYRVAPPAPQSGLRDAAASITAALAPDAIVDIRTYLEVK